MQLVEVFDLPVRGQGDRNQGYSAEDVLRTETLDQRIDVRHTIEQRQDDALLADRRRDRIHGRLQIVGLAGNDNDVEVFVQGVLGDDLGRDLHITERAGDLQSVLA